MFKVTYYFADGITFSLECTEKQWEDAKKAIASGADGVITVQDGKKQHIASWRHIIRAEVVPVDG